MKIFQLLVVHIINIQQCYLEVSFMLLSFDKNN